MLGCFYLDGHLQYVNATIMADAAVVTNSANFFYPSSLVSNRQEDSSCKNQQKDTKNNAHINAFNLDEAGEGAEQSVKLNDTISWQTFCWQTSHAGFFGWRSLHIKKKCQTFKPEGKAREIDFPLALSQFVDSLVFRTVAMTLWYKLPKTKNPHQQRCNHREKSVW